MIKEEKNKATDAEPDFISLIWGSVLFFSSLALLVNFDIFEHGWIFFFVILTMLIAGGINFFSEVEKILNSIYQYRLKT